MNLEIKHLRTKSFGARIMLLAASASLAPWLLAACFLVRGSATTAITLAILAVCATSICLIQLDRKVRPIETVAKRIRRQTEEAGSDPSPGDELTIIFGFLDQLQEKIASLQHRWIQKHPVTNLPTREYLLEEMAKDIEHSDKEVLLGIVRFKDYDRLSVFDAVAADAALKAFAIEFRGAAGTSHPLAQVDRDSFGIWFRGSSPDDAQRELQALRYTLSAEINAGVVTLVPEVAASAALYPTDGTEPSALVVRTLLSSHDALNGLESDVSVTTPKGTEAARERFSLEQDLRKAIEREEFELHFQPIVDLDQGRLDGAEALIRWRHPQAGLISPSYFIPILEEASLTEDVGMWALNAACRACRKWRLSGLEQVSVAVNLSAKQLKTSNLVQLIARTLERHGLPPQALALELTETAAMEDSTRTFTLFSELREMGVSLSIDDFGSGYSSLSYVKNLPFDKLKIDREFVVDVHERRDSQAICRTLIELSRGLGIRVLAEGVERKSEVAMLQRFGCHLFQGFYFGKPLPEKDFVTLAMDADWQQGLHTQSCPTHSAAKDRVLAC